MKLNRSNYDLISLRTLAIFFILLFFSTLNAQENNLKSEDEVYTVEALTMKPSALSSADEKDNDKRTFSFNKELMMQVKKNYFYPKSAKRNKIEGRVVITCILNEDGSLSNFEIVKSAHDDLNEAALKIASKLKKFDPGRFDGKKVKTRINIPISFKLMTIKR